MVAMVDDNDGALRRPAKAGLALIVMLMLPTWRGITARRRATMKGVRVTLGLVTYDVSFDCKGNPATVMGYYVRDGGRIVWAKDFGVRPACRIQVVIAAAVEAKKANRGVAKQSYHYCRRRDSRRAYRSTEAIIAAADELSPPDDKTMQFRLKKPFPLLPDGLGKSLTNCPAMMPERLAQADAFTQVTEMVGSGAFKFNAKECVPGALVVYEKFADYVPRTGGTPD